MQNKKYPETTTESMRKPFPEGYPQAHNKHTKNTLWWEMVKPCWPGRQTPETWAAVACCSHAVFFPQLLTKSALRISSSKQLQLSRGARRQETSVAT